MNLKRLQTALLDAAALWQPGEMVGEFHLGYCPGPGNRSLQEREAAAANNFRHGLQGGTRAVGANPPPVIDWRRWPETPPLPAGGYVTPVRDQKTCDSSASFGTIAAFEAALRIAAKNPRKAIDLAEADLVRSQAGVRPGGNGLRSWYPEGALIACQKTGVIDENGFPHPRADQPSGKCRGWRPRMTKIRAWKKLTATAEMKRTLASHGPLIACMNVYEDFFHYHAGIYHHVGGTLQGGHCVCCVGYDDRERFWICKNSWTAAWGEKGFFRIAYGECAIDASMWMLKV
jgi:C1A family cysteine protease